MKRCSIFIQLDFLKSVTPILFPIVSESALKRGTQRWKQHKEDQSEKGKVQQLAENRLTDCIVPVL